MQSRHVGIGYFFFLHLASFVWFLPKRQQLSSPRNCALALPARRRQSRIKCKLRWMIKCLHPVLILSIYTCDRVPSDGGGSAGSAGRRRISVTPGKSNMCLITSVLRMCLITSSLSVPNEHFCLSVFSAPVRTRWSRSCVPILRWSCELQSARWSILIQTPLRR
jgi:hypothetical protein